MRARKMWRMRAVLILLALTLSASSELRAQGEKEDRPPNLLIDVSAGLIQTAVRRPVDRMEPFTDVIVDTPISGVARVVGGVEAELIPDPHRAAIDIVVGGRTYAKSIGTQGHVLLHTYTITS